jgi:hypothetical protein
VTTQEREGVGFDLGREGHDVECRNHRVDLRSARRAATASPRQGTGGPSSSRVRDPRGAGTTTPRRMRSSRRVVAAFPAHVIGLSSATGVSRSITTKRVPPRTTRRYRDRWFLSSPIRTDFMIANLVLRFMNSATYRGGPPLALRQTQDERRSFGIGKNSALSPLVVSLSNHERVRQRNCETGYLAKLRGAQQATRVRSDSTPPDGPRHTGEAVPRSEALRGVDGASP